MVMLNKNTSLLIRIEGSQRFPNIIPVTTEALLNVIFFLDCDPIAYNYGISTSSSAQIFPSGGAQRRNPISGNVRRSPGVVVSGNVFETALLDTGNAG